MTASTCLHVRQLHVRQQSQSALTFAEHSGPLLNLEAGGSLPKMSSVKQRQAASFRNE
jgi:hypothetical protein